MTLTCSARRDPVKTMARGAAAGATSFWIHWVDLHTTHTHTHVWRNQFDKHSTTMNISKTQDERAARLAGDRNSNCYNGNRRHAVSNFKGLMSFSLDLELRRTAPLRHWDFCTWNVEIAAAWSNCKCHCAVKPPPSSKSKLMRKAPAEKHAEQDMTPTQAC